MGTLTEGIRDAVGFAFCASARAADGVGSLLSSLPIATEGIQTQIDRYRAFACGDDPMASEPVGTPPPFSGGQCEGVNYLVTCGVEYTNRGVVEVSALSTALVTGKILDIYPLLVGSQTIRVEIETSGGVVVERTIQGGFGSSFANPFIFGLSITRQDGLPDDCGSLPTSRPDPIEEVDDELDITYDDPSGNPVTLPNVPIKFFKPCINLDGIRVPFELDTPFGKICGKVGIAPSLTDIIEPDIDIDLCPEQREDLGYGEEEIKDFFEFLPALGAAVNFPEPDLAGTLSSNWNVDDPPILGAFIRGRKTEPQGGGKTIVLKEETASTPNIIIPRIGTIFFEYLVKKEDGYESAFSEDIPIKNVNQFIPCPWDFGATRVHFKNEIGWEFSVFPVARKSCCESCAGNDPKKLDELDRCRID